ncbi:MAG: sugar phosphate isomerase/epimerase family protein [Deferrisomatales bacterium]
MPQPLALSTSYFTLRDPPPSGEALVAEAAALGFRHLELDYRVRPDQLPALTAALTRGELAVVSVHHPFPLAPGVNPALAHLERPNPASLDPDERRAALLRAGETLARAADLGVGAVVMHFGRVELPGEASPRALERLFRAGRRESPEYAALLEGVVRARAEAAPAHLDAALSALDRLAGEAQRRGVRVGLENRYHAHEMPSRPELDRIFRELDGAPLGYWHDTGHAAALAALGFLESPTEFLGAFGHRLVGMHLHDARGLDDPRAPGDGELEFGPLASFCGEETRLVVEVHPRAPAEAVAGCRGVLAGAGLPLA